MRDFNKVSPTLWQSARFKGLPSDDGRFLLFYLLTCPHNNSAGCFWLPDGYACPDLGWAQDRFDTSLQSLIDADNVDHDADNQVVLVRRWFRHNPPMNQSHYKGILGQLEKAPSDRLRDKAYTALEACQNDADQRKGVGGKQQSDVQLAPSVSVSDKLMQTPYIAGTRRR